MLHVHRSERADHLVVALGDLLLGPPADPLAREVVAVPTRGVERWLTQRLSHRLGVRGDGDGVCANVEFPFPGTLVRSATSRACGFDPDADPWPPDRSVWPLLDLVDDLLDEPFLAPLAAHLRAADPDGGKEDPSGPGRRPRRFATIRHLADLYDRYAVHRPEMVGTWADGGEWDGAAHPDLAWQAELWRRLRRRIGVPSPAERFETAAGRLAAEPALLDLPERLSLFGLTRLPASHLRVLEAVAGARDVHLFLLHPSGALWDKVHLAAPRPPAYLRREDDGTAPLPANPLLRSWGRDAREMQLVLASHGVTPGEHRPVRDGSGTVLGLIQSDVREDRTPPGPRRPGDAADPRPLLRRGDDSLRLHSCHGKARQVEVVRDAVLHLLAEDPTLEPRDVIVMCPDIESFAPLVHAAFGAGDPGRDDGGDPAEGPGAGEGAGPPPLRVRLADRSIRQTNPLLSVAADLLELAGSRVTASQVIDLASREPVSRRFRFDEEDLSQIERWVAGTGIRWGLDGAHRAPWSLGRLEANTWRAGVDRLLLGVAMGEEGQRLFGDALPFDDVSSAGVDLAGRFTEMVSRLQDTLDELRGPQPVGTWTRTLSAGTERLAVASSGDGWQHDQLHRVLGEVEEEADAGADRPVPAPADLDLAEVRSLLGERLRGRPTRANFRTGDLTICTLVPMRSVPHRVVCLLGLDDGVFPRHAEQDGDDLLLADPRVGDRDARSEDRQLLLDALLAATEHLIITFEGRDQRTNQERPPAVPVAELLDVVDRTVRVEDKDGRARDAVLVRHPLQSYDARNFAEGALLDDRPWSFDPVNLEGARALASGDRRPPQPFLAGRLPPQSRPVIQLDSLIRFVEHPVKAFLRERLGLYVTDGPDQVNDALPVELDALEKWGVGDRILEARLDGADPERAVQAERGRGLLPPGPLADAVVADVSATVEALVAAVEALPCADAEPESVEVNLRLPDGRAVVGTVPGVRDGTVVRCVFSRLGPKHRLAAWVRFLALAAGCPEVPVSAVTIGRGQGNTRTGPRVRTSTLEIGGPPAARQGAALDALMSVVHLYDRGMQEPLPLYCCTSAAWAAAMRDDSERAVEAARREWRSEPESPVPGEDSDPEHVLVLGSRSGFDEVRAEEPRDYELAGPWPGAGWPEGERSRFGGLARMLWDPLLDHERLD